MDNIITACILSYLFGSIPFGLILSNIWGNGKLREQGSGNIGSTNVLRTQGKLLGGLTLVLDVAKAFIIVFFYRDFSVLVFCMAIIGHIYPIWLKFKGGKGVASFLGGMLALDPTIGGICLGVWLLIFICFRISSVAGLSACIIGSIIYILELGSFEFLDILLLTIICLLIAVRHRDNIERLLKHKECGISMRK